MKKYPSIEQFRSVVRTVKTQHDYQGKDENGEAIYQHLSNYPTLKFQGTVKLHGTNASVVKYKDGRLEYQSRERVLSLEQDNANFMMSMMPKNLDFLFSDIKFEDYCAVYGEWCGGNIQKGVAINGLPKMFIIFGIKVDDEWVELPSWKHDNENGIYNILQFPTFDVDIDFNNPELIQNKLLEDTLAVDVEALAGIQEFVDSVVTENRLEQGLAYLYEMKIEISPKTTGEFLGWVVRDVLKEETDTIVANQFDMKKVKGAIVNKARMWYLNRL